MDPSYSPFSHTPTAAVNGLLSLGYQINHVAQSGFRESEWMPCDLCVIYGMRNFGKRIIQEHESRGVRCIVIDLGYIKRAMKSNGYNGYWQVSLGGLNWVPDSAPDDRWKMLGLDYPVPVDRDGYVLLAEQTPNDASHGLKMDDLNKWMDRAVRSCKKKGIAYKKRRHPMNSFIPDDEKPNCPIEDDLSGASAVYCHNSNVGNDALLAGIPVICDDWCEYAPTYIDLASKEISKDVSFPEPEKIKDYLHRLSYAQWTRDELANGEAFRYVLSV